MRFELSVASNESFCNRDSQRKTLRIAMMDGTSVWVQAPRRYGKTSLVRQAAAELVASGEPVSLAPVDFMITSSIGEACSKIVKAIEDQVAEMESNPEQVLTWVRKSFKRAVIEIVGNKATAKLKSAREATKDEVEDAIMGLDMMLKGLERRVIIHLDEFQKLGEIDPSYSIEGVIRHCVERVKNITFIFSGSNRHLMEQAMGGSSRPMFHHSVCINLKRISQDDYTKHIQAAAMEKWKQPLEQSALDNIFMFARCHAFFTSALCRSVFAQDKAPNASDVVRHWKEVVEADLPVIQSELGSVTTNMLAVVKALAVNGESEPTSTAFAEKSGVKVGSLSAAVKSLYEKDIIEKRGPNGEWALLSPSMEYFIRSNIIE